jgi:hypothetical protein
MWLALICNKRLCFGSLSFTFWNYSLAHSVDAERSSAQGYLLFHLSSLQIFKGITSVFTQLEVFTHLENPEFLQLS